MVFEVVSDQSELGFGKVLMNCVAKQMFEHVEEHQVHLVGADPFGGEKEQRIHELDLTEMGTVLIMHLPFKRLFLIRHTLKGSNISAPLGFCRIVPT